MRPLPAFFLLAFLASSQALHGQIQLNRELEDALRAVPEEKKPEAARVYKALVAYRRSEKALLEKSLRDLDRLEKRVDVNRDLSSSKRAKHLAEISANRRAIQAGTSLVECQVTREIVLAAEKKFRGSKAILEKPIRTFVRQLNLAQLRDSAKRVASAFDLLGGALNAKSTLVPGTAFGGRRKADEDKNGDGSPIRFVLGDKNGDLSVGTVEKNRGYTGHPVHELKWEIEGLTIRATTGKPKKLENRKDAAIRYEGLVLGKAIIGRFHNPTAKPKWRNGAFRLEAK